MKRSPSAVDLSDRLLTGLTKVGLALRNVTRERGERWALTATQSQVLVLLRARSEGGLRLSTVACELGVTRPTACDAVTALVRKRLVRKVRSPEDGRAVRLTLTAEGMRAATAMSEWPPVLLEAAGVLSERERVVVLRGLIKMIRALEERRRLAFARMCVACTYFRPYVHPEAAQPHHCDFLGAPIGDANLQIDCRQHERASDDRCAATGAVLAAHSDSER